MTSQPEFQNQAAPGTGTPLDFAHLSPLVVAQSYLINGTAPAASGLATALTVPTQIVTINAGNGTALEYTIASAAPTGTSTNNTLNYIDAKSDGTGFVWTTGAPSGTNVRLYSVGINSGGTVTGVARLATTRPIGQSMVDLHGLVSYKSATLNTDTSPLSATSWATVPNMPTLTFTTLTGELNVRVSARLGSNDSFGSFSPTSFPDFTFGFSTGGATNAIGGIVGITAIGAWGSALYTTGGFGYGVPGTTYTVTLKYMVNSGSFRCQPVATSGRDFLAFEVFDALS